MPCYDPPRPGWDCTACNRHNAWEHKTCMKCGAPPRPPEALLVAPAAFVHQLGDLDTITRLACEFCRVLDGEGEPIPEWARDWWGRHKAWDKTRTVIL